MDDDAYTYPVETGYFSTEVDVDWRHRAAQGAGFEFDANNMLSASTPISFEYLTNEGSGNVGIAECIQQDLAVIGINMTIRTCDWNVFLNDRKNGNYDIARQWLAGRLQRSHQLPGDVDHRFRQQRLPVRPLKHPYPKEAPPDGGAPRLSTGFAPFPLMPAGVPDRKQWKPGCAGLPNPPHMSAGQAARWKRAASPPGGGGILPIQSVGKDTGHADFIGEVSAPKGFEKPEPGFLRMGEPGSGI